jgi:hypothetical protein
MAPKPVTRSVAPSVPIRPPLADFQREFREFGGWLASVCRATHLVPVLVGMAVVGSCFIGLWAALHRHPSAPAWVPNVVKGPAPIEPLWGLAQQKPATCAASESRHVSVAIGKRARTVLVDGARAELHHGFVDIEGVLGSVHVVRLDDGAEAEVAITLHGAFPSKVEP